VLDAAWLNAVQEELCNALEGLGNHFGQGHEHAGPRSAEGVLSSVLSFGDSAALNRTQGRPSSSSPASAICSPTVALFAAPVAGVLRNLRVNAGTASTGATAFDKITVMVNGVDTSITCSLSPGETSDSDTAHSATVSAGDLIEVKVTRSGAGIAVPAANVVVALALTMG
jgi:hypothetical protein